MSLQNRGNKRGAIVRQRNLEANLQTNPVEDGNYSTSTYTDQGFLYTAEIDNSEYINAYGENTANVTSAISNKERTGNDFYYDISVSYTVEGSSTQGWFGNSIINSGEPFVIKSISSTSPPYINYIKGFIVKIINETLTTVSASSTVVNYTLLCAITDGDTAQLNNAAGYTFSTNRRVFSYGSRKAPVNLESTYDAVNQKVNFYWQDSTQQAVGYNLLIRSENVGEYNQLFKVSGNSLNFNGKVEPLIIGSISSQSLAGIKIVNPGYDYAFPSFKPVFVTSGNPPDATFFTDNCGSLEITDWEIVNATGCTGNSVQCTITAKNNSSEISENQYIDTGFGDGVCVGLTALGGPPYAYNTTVVFVKQPFVNSADAYNKLFRKNVKVHTGVILNNAGSDLTKAPVVTYDKYKDGTKFSIDVNGLGLLAGNYYWCVSAIFDCERKTYSDWCEESTFSVSFPVFDIYGYGGYNNNGYETP